MGAGMRGVKDGQTVGPESGNGYSTGVGGQGFDVMTGRPVWKQLRALLVFAVLMLLVIHQLYLGRLIVGLQEQRRQQ